MPPSKDDPHAIFNGAAVASLAGILRQLGDLAEFAGDVFHGLHELVTTTEARGRKMLTRVQNVETALPSVEKVIKHQRSHLNFAHVAGSEWHARPLDEQNVLLANELPRSMMESYEKCRDPPRLYLLDKFDHTGNGGCLKRYSDPSYFRRVLALNKMEKAEYIPRKRKMQKLKKKSSRIRNREMFPSVYITKQFSRNGFSLPNVDGQSFSTDNFSMFDEKSNPEILSRSASIDCKTKERYIQATSLNLHPTKIEYDKVPDHILRKADSCPIASSGVCSDPFADDLDDILHVSLHEHSIPSSSSVNCDEKTDIILMPCVSCNDSSVDRFQDSDCQSINQGQNCMGSAKDESSKQGIILLDPGNLPTSLDDINHFDEVTSETDKYVDALNTLEPETEAESESQNNREEELIPCINSRVNGPKNDRIQAAVLQSPDFLNKKAPNNISPATLNQDIFQKSSNFCSIGSPGHMQSPHASDFTKMEYPDIIEPCEDRMDAISGGGYSICSDLIPETGISSPQVFVEDETPAKKPILKAPLPSTLGFPSVQLWTNGGLFGVEPSKPREQGHFSGSNEKLTSYIRNQSDYINSNGDFSSSSSPALGSTNGNLLLPRNEFERKSKFSTMSKNSPGIRPSVETKVANAITVAGTDAPDGPAQSTKVISSAFSDLAQRFLANTLQRKISITGGFTSTVAGMANGIGEKHGDSQLINGHVPVAAVSEASYGDHFSYVPQNEYSGKSSPPLGHIKISVHPINSMEISKLQSLSSDVSCQEDGDDFLLPSCTLLQSSVYPCSVSCSDSDDDTFSRSCPYSSEDFPSPGSCSYSEIWDKHSSEYKEDDLHGFRNKCSFQKTSTSSYIGLEQINLSNLNVASERHNLQSEKYETPFKTRPFVELPDFDSVMLFRNMQGGTSSYLPDNILHHEEDQNDGFPPPPPLPPAQWRILESCATSDADEAIANHASYVHQLAQQLSPQKEISPRFPSIIEGNKLHKDLKPNPVYGSDEVNDWEQLLPEVNSQRHEQKINGHNLNVGSKIAKDMDEHEGLLDQIRNKSFNLRRTNASKFLDLPSSTTNVSNANLVAILEKATAIRQAFVGSDEGVDDEKWSDG